jgi:predicted amidohydrolase
MSRSVRLILVQPQLRHDSEADNLARVRSALLSSQIEPRRDDIVLLPERVMLTTAPEDYAHAMRTLAAELGCTLVGGSHHEARGSALVNTGMAVAADGRVLGRYEKVRPYGAERANVVPGTMPTVLEIGGKRVLVLICADFWFSDLVVFAPHPLDLVLVPALSVSRKPSPEYSRALWRHLAIARAYELGAYVGVSDWGHPSELPVLSTSGVGGLADPTSTVPEELFRPIAPSEARAFDLDFAALELFRQDRKDRGFFRT